jgi:hypothetical protein
MSGLTPERVAEFETVLRRVQAWVGAHPDIHAIALAGSWAAGRARMDSDVDLVVLCDDPDRFEHAVDWVSQAVPGSGRVTRTAWWGPLLERRIALASGLEVEFGFVTDAWAAVDPIDHGTARVVRDGFHVLYDPSGLLGRVTRYLAVE